MDEKVQELLVEVKTQLWTASLTEIQTLAEKYLPLMKKGETRPKLVVALEEWISSLTKEEDSADKLGELLAAFTKAKTPVKKEPEEAMGATEDTTPPLIPREMLRTFMKEFKISGSIGDGSTCIGYLSFLRQLESGRNMGHTDRELVDGTIKAIQAGSKLRGYLEGRKELQLSELQAIVRAAYKEKNSTELYQELCSLKQECQESVQEFLFRGLEIKQKITFANKEAGYDEKLVEHQFRESLSTGLRNRDICTDAIRLIEKYQTDEELIQGFNDIERRYEEREAKLRSRVKVSSATEDPVLRELRALRADVNELKI